MCRPTSLTSQIRFIYIDPIRIEIAGGQLLLPTLMTRAPHQPHRPPNHIAHIDREKPHERAAQASGSEVRLEHPMGDRRGKRERSEQEPPDGVAKPQAGRIVEVLTCARGKKGSSQQRS